MYCSVLYCISGTIGLWFILNNWYGTSWLVMSITLIFFFSFLTGVIRNLACVPDQYLTLRIVVWNTGYKKLFSLLIKIWCFHKKLASLFWKSEFLICGFLLYVRWRAPWFTRYKPCNFSCNFVLLKLIFCVHQGGGDKWCVPVRSILKVWYFSKMG